MILLKIMRHEWRALTSDATAWLIIGAFAVTVGYALIHSERFVRNWRSTQAEFAQVEQAAIDEIRRRNEETARRIENGEIREIPEWSNKLEFSPLYPLWAQNDRYKSPIRPLSPLALLALGQTDIYPVAYDIDWWSGPAIINAVPGIEQATNPSKMLVGNFDLAFVVVYLMPLFILALSYNLIAAEKESGVLWLLLSQPISLRTLLFAKVLVRVALIFGTALLFILIGLVITGFDWRERDVTLKLMLWLLAVVLYGAIWFGLALLVNARGRNSASNAVVLAACWLAFVLLIPATCIFIAKVVYPIPSRTELMNARRETAAIVGFDLYTQGWRELDDDNSRTSRLVENFLAENPDVRIADLPLPNQTITFTHIKDRQNVSPKWRTRLIEQKSPIVLAARSAEVDRLTQPVREEFDRQYNRQHQLMNRLNVLSPSLLTQSIFTYLSGTSPAQHDRFLQQVERHQREWRRFFLKKSLSLELIKPSDYDTFPYFQYQEEPLESVIACIKLPLLVLTLSAMLLTALGFWRFKSYPVVG